MVALSLRLFTPGDGSDAPEFVTLRDVFEQHRLPQLIHNAPATIESYRNTLSRWEQVIGRPRIEQIGFDLLLEFQQRLLAQHLAPATVNKHFRTLKPLIALLWPRDRSNPDGLGWIDYFRFPPQVPVQRGIPKVLSEQQLNQLYAACESATWPRCLGLTPGLIWRAWLVLAINVGARSYDSAELQWSDVDWTTASHQPFGAVQFCMKKVASVHRVPLNSCCRQHLEAIWSRRNAVFPRMRRTNKQTVGRHWSAICERAGVDCVREDLRKTANTMIENHERGAGRFVLGHSTNDVNTRYYFNHSSLVTQAVTTLPLPAAFVDGAASLKSRLPRRVIG